ncbi:MAG: hypothetical protein ACLPKB_10260 [Xanthobacteraceae bacterium]
MGQLEFVNELNIKRFQNLLETSVDDVERQIIQKLLTEEEAKQAASKSSHLDDAAAAQ